MRCGLIISVMVLTGCVTLAPDKPVMEDRIGLSPRNIAPGECGLFVWNSDQAKTFILYADQKSAAFYRGGTEVALSFGPETGKAEERLFIDERGQTLSLSLFEAQPIERSTRYKSGRLSTRDSNGWETVIPVVGLFTCKPLIS